MYAVRISVPAGNILGKIIEITHERNPRLYFAGTDIALLQVEAANLIAIPESESCTLKIADFLLLFEFGDVRCGLLGRLFTDLIPDVAEALKRDLEGSEVKIDLRADDLIAAINHNEVDSPESVQA